MCETHESDTYNKRYIEIASKEQMENVNVDERILIGRDGIERWNKTHDDDMMLMEEHLYGTQKEAKQTFAYNMYWSGPLMRTVWLGVYVLACLCVCVC